MTRTFLVKSRHGTIYYFRRRVPTSVQHVIGRRMIVQTLDTSDRRVAVVRGRALAARTDSIFQCIVMAAKTNKSDGFTFDYTMKLDFNEMGLPSSLFVEAKPDGQEAVNSAIRAALDGARERGSTIKSASPQKAFSGAITEYFSKAQIKAQTKATYRSKLNHAEQFFGGSKDILSIDQADFVRYCDHVLATVTNISSQGHYITTVATFLN